MKDSWREKERGKEGWKLRGKEGRTAGGKERKREENEGIVGKRAWRKDEKRNIKKRGKHR